MDAELAVTDTPDPDDLRLVGRELAAFNDADVGPSERRPLVVFGRADDGSLIAGLNGYTAWGWLYVQWLWVAAARRGEGLAGRLLRAAETEARGRGCHGALIDTFSPLAEKVYRRQGYEVFGALDDFPMGRRRLFLKKAL